MRERADRKRKDYKKTQKAKDNDKNKHSPFDAEMLRIQGLIRCIICENSYPFMQPRCPTCDAPNKEHYPAKM